MVLSFSNSINYSCIFSSQNSNESFVLSLKGSFSFSVVILRFYRRNSLMVRDIAMAELILVPHMCHNAPDAVPSSHLDKICLWHSRYSCVSRVSISADLSFWHHIFGILLIFDNHVCQTRQRNIKLGPFMPKPLLMQHSILQADILNLDSTFPYCRTTFDICQF